MINIVSFKRHIIDLALNGSFSPEGTNFEQKQFKRIANIFTGDSTNDEQKAKYSVFTANSFPYVSTKDISMNGVVDYENGMYIPRNDSGFEIAPKGSVLLCIEGGNAGNKLAILDRDVCFVNKLCCFVPNGVESKYIYYYLQSNQFRENFKGQMTGLIGGVSIRKIKDLLVPIPSLPVQNQIVSKIDDIFHELNIVEEKQNDLLELKEKLRSKVVDLAIRGKLAEQIPDEGTAEELINYIQIKKAELVKKRVIKKTKTTSKVTEDDLPFSIPTSWKWIRLADICTKIVDGDHNPPSGVGFETDYLMISAININHDKICELDRIRFLTKEVFEIENERTRLTKGDILLTIVGTMGRSCIYDGELNLTFQRSVSVISTMIFNEYLKRVFDSTYVRTFMEENSTGTAQKGFYLNQVAELLIPVPPLKEQIRIVDKLNDILSNIELLFK